MTTKIRVIAHNCELHDTLKLPHNLTTKSIFCQALKSLHCLTFFLLYIKKISFKTALKNCSFMHKYAVFQVTASKSQNGNLHLPLSRTQIYFSSTFICFLSILPLDFYVLFVLKVSSKFNLLYISVKQTV